MEKETTNKMGTMPVKKTYAVYGNSYNNFHDAASTL